MRPPALRILNRYRALLAVLLLLVLAMPVRAQPPEAEGIAVSSRAAGIEAGSEPSQASPDPPGPWPRLTLRSGCRLLRNLLFLLAVHSAATGGAAQPAMNSPFAFGTLPNFNLSGTDPASLLAAQGVAQALVNANGTGALPPLEALNGMLVQYSLTRQSVLATLPPALLQPVPDSGTPADDLPPVEEAEATGPDKLIPAGPSDISLESDAVLSEDFSAAQSNLQATILTEAYYIQNAIGLNLLADASLFPQDVPYLFDALSYAANELLSTGAGTAAVASRVQVQAAQRVISALEARQKKQAAGPGAAGSKATGQSKRLEDFLDPKLIYGFWQRLETDDSGRRVRYQVTPTGVSKRTETPNPDGGRRVQSEVRPGAVDGFVSYDTGGLGAGTVNVTIQLAQANGQTVSRDFVYLRANSSDPDQPGTLDVLVEQQGDHHAYVRIARF
jgi:hypothetical protein